MNDLFAVFQEWYEESPDDRDLAHIILFADGSGKLCTESPSYRSFAVWGASTEPSGLAQAVAAIKAITRPGRAHAQLRESMQALIARSPNRGTSE